MEPIIKSLARILNLPFYPWMAGIYPILHLYAENLGLVFDDEVVTVLVLMLIATTIAFVAATLVLRNRFKAAFLLAICSLCFSLSGHVHVLAFAALPIDSWTEIVVIVAVVTLYCFHMRGSAELYERITVTANLVSLALIIWPLVAIVSDLTTRTDIDLGLHASGFSNVAQQAIPEVNDSPTHPDIYYIIPDGYPSDRWSQTAMNYDNSEFTRALESRGFVVVDHAQSNYGATLPSLASILNMRYFDRNESGLDDVDYLRLSIANNAIARYLRQKGYMFVQFLSNFLFPSPIADINRDFTPHGTIDIEVSHHGLSEATTQVIQGGKRQTIDLGSLYKQSFLSLYLETTVLRIVAADIKALTQPEDPTPFAFYAAERFLDTIDEVASVVAMPEATFTMVHLLKPHRPVNFDAQGNIIEEIAYPNHEQFLAALSFLNSQFLQMFDTILDGSRYPPIIIFQADHGSKYGSVRADDRRLIHFDTYAAYYLPESYAIRFPQPYTIINSFPLIFNEVFAADFPIQDDRLFEILEGYDAPFEQIEVTQEFAH